MVKLSKFVLFSGMGAVLITGVLASTIAVTDSISSRQVFETVSNGFEQSQNQQMLATTAQDIRLDVVQVQQWLTDVSATRGLDGLNDGFDEAANYADKFAEDLASARALAQAVDARDLQTKLDVVEQAFGPYYEAGTDMAHAYVEFGPAAGNKQMGQFDTAAADIGDAVGQMVAQIELMNKNVGTQLSADLDATFAQKGMVSMASAITQALIVLGLLGLILFIADKFNTLRKVAEVATAIADGDLQAPRLGTSKWQELSDLYKSIGVFRDNGEKLKLFQQDIDRQLIVAADHNGQISAIGRSQAVISFDIDGTILDANDNFQQALGYSLAEIKGRKHSMFVDTHQANSPEYAKFWADLRAGTFVVSEFARVRKGGSKVWIQASYNPIFDTEGKVVKVVKYATDVTDRKTAVLALGESLKLLAEGNLGARIETKLSADFEDVRLALNNTVDRFVDIVSQLRETSRGLKVATGEILAGANDLSERTTKQAATIEETSAAMEQLSTTVLSNASQAEQAANNSAAVSKTAADGEKVMHEATAAMERITASSGKISNIIGMIDDIAFQTNLLALNASVEAARAGEAGRGFAVVAVEVRRLAQSAAEASNQVKQLIESSAGEVEVGSQLVAEASGKLGNILEGVKASSALMNSIAAESRAQATSIEEVNTSVRIMDEMTQHNAALVEETTAAIEQTEAQAANLDTIVAIFRTETQHAPLTGHQRPHMHNVAA